jgi:hypothetical protein
VERDGAAVRRVELLGAGAHVVEPPGVGLAEPAAQRRVLEAVVRDVRVFEHGLHVRLGQALGVVLDAGARAREGPLRRVVGGHAHAPALEVDVEVGLARQRVGERAELQAAQDAQLEAEPARREVVRMLAQRHQSPILIRARACKAS